MNKQVALLRKAYKIEKDAKVRERILMNVYTIQGEVSRAVAARLQCDQKLVLYWINRYEKEGLEGLKTKPKSGKPRDISRRQEEKIKKIVTMHDSANPWTTKRIAELIFQETGVHYAQRHVQRMLHRWGLTLLVPRPTFWQKASGEEMKRFWKKNPVEFEDIPFTHSHVRR